MPFKIFSNCVAVKGHSRSTICDLQRNKIHLIPNSLYDILIEFKDSSIKIIKEKFNGEYNDIIDEYFSFLEREELLFFTPNPDWFPDLSLKWEYPFKINNCIIDIDSTSNFDFKTIFESLNNLDCKFLEFRSYSPMDLASISGILFWTKETTIASISLILHFNNEVGTLEWESLCDGDSRITSLVLHSSPEPINCNSPKFAVPITYTNKILTDEKCCGVINEGYFISYTETFTEAMHHNSCLNRKVSIDRKGNIKNCPSLHESFGNVASSSLEIAVNQESFSKYWNISKDKIEVCKDCEFRYVCTDCRAYIEKPEDLYSKPIKCGYDPYTCNWEDWSKNPLKQHAIEIYGFEKI